MIIEVITVVKSIIIIIILAIILVAITIASIKSIAIMVVPVINTMIIIIITIVVVKSIILTSKGYNFVPNCNNCNITIVTEVKAFTSEIIITLNIVVAGYLITTIVITKITMTAIGSTIGDGIVAFSRFITMYMDSIIHIIVDSNINVKYYFRGMYSD